MPLKSISGSSHSYTSEWFSSINIDHLIIMIDNEMIRILLKQRPRSLDQESQRQPFILQVRFTSSTARVINRVLLSQAFGRRHGSEWVNLQGLFVAKYWYGSFRETQALTSLAIKPSYPLAITVDRLPHALTYRHSNMWCCGTKNESIQEYYIW